MRENLQSIANRGIDLIGRKIPYDQEP